MPKHYKEVVEDIINKMNEAKAMGGKLIVRMKRPGQKTVSAIFDTKAQADAYEKEKKKLGFQIEDAPANSVAGGGVDLAPNAAVSQSPHMIKRKKEQGAEQEKIKNKIKKMVQNNEDNNNIVFKQILDSLDKVETKLDEKINGKTEIKVEEEKKYKTFRDKYNG